MSRAIRSFDCPIHVGEPILRVSRNHLTKKRAFCVECIMETDTKYRNDLIHLDSLIDDLYEYLTSIENAKMNSEPPKDVIDVIHEEQSILSKFSHHIYLQKLKVNTEIQRMQDQVIKVFEKTKDSILSSLDLQFELFKRNCEEFKDKLRRYFYFDSDPKKVVTRQNLLEEINSCKSTEELEIKLDLIFNEADEIRYSLDEIRRGLKTSTLDTFRAQRIHILNSITYLPDNYLTSEKYHSSEYDHLLSHLHDFLQHITLFNNEVLPFNSPKLNLTTKPFVEEVIYQPSPPTYVQDYPSSPVRTYTKVSEPYYNDIYKQDSRLLTATDVAIIESWIREKIYGARLLYRATRDSFDLKRVLNAWNPNPSVLMIIRTRNGEIIGCYRDRPRNPSVTEKFNNYVTFSLTLKAKLDEQRSYADLAVFDIGNVFISNSLFLVNNSHKVEGSYYTLNPSVDVRSSVKGREVDSSINYFLTDEIEIFQLDTTRRMNDVAYIDRSNRVILPPI